MEYGTRQKICQLVAGIIIADDLLDEKESAFIDRLIKSFGIGETGREVIFPLVDRNEASAQIRELPQDAQDLAFALMIDAACVDAQIAPEERAYLIAIASALGIPETELAKRVAERLGAASKNL